MLQFIKKAGRKRDIVKSPSLNVERSNSDVIDSSNASDEELLLSIEFQILNDESLVSSQITKNIHRIVNDKNCLCYFVQYLEKKAALPLIRFWLDVESFKSSTEQCTGGNFGHRKGGSKCSNLKTVDETDKAAITRSVSLDGHVLTLNRDDYCHAFNDDEYVDNSESNHNDLPSERDNGDGSSDANSMTNLSDICERDDDDNEQKHDHDHNRDHNPDDEIEFYENGRKSATGASSHDDIDLDSMAERPASNLAKSLPTSAVIDAIRIFNKYLLNGELNSLVRIPTNILSQISLVLCVQNETTTKSPPESSESIASKLSVSMESIPMSLSAAQLDESHIATVFDQAQTFILDYLDETFINGFLESQFYYLYCIENTGVNLKITDILYNETALFYFMEFLELESKRKFLDFWLAAMNFKRQIDYPVGTSDDAEINRCTNDRDKWTEQVMTKSTNEQSQNDALILYEKYFSLQATCPLHFSDRVRFQIEEKICSIDDGATIRHSFDLPLAIIERFLGEKYLRAFERSNLFYKYLSEMMQKAESLNAASVTIKSDIVNQNGFDDSMTSSKKRAESKSGKKDYANAISAKNTLLAMESVKKRRNQRIPSSASDMCIDSRQLHDPDLLWRRNSTSGLMFGRINALGRYERDYDMTPCEKSSSNTVLGSGGIVTGGSGGDANQILQNTGSKIARAVRKLVHLPEQCMQEELAWQMAEMIVNDITSITLQPNQVPK